MEESKKQRSGMVFVIAKCVLALALVLLTIFTDPLITEGKAAWLAFDLFMVEVCLLSPAIFVLYWIFARFNRRTGGKSILKKVLFGAMFFALDLAFFVFFVSMRGMP